MIRPENEFSQSVAKSITTWAMMALHLGLSTLALTLAPTTEAFGRGPNACESARNGLHEAKSWAARYQPLATRGGMYRKAYAQALLDATSAEAKLQAACLN